MKIYSNKRFEDVLGNAEMNAYHAGKTAGESWAKHKLGEDLMMELMAKSLNDFNNDELKLGYNHAVDVVRAIIERNRP